MSIKRKTCHLPAKINCDESLDPTTFQPSISCSGLPHLPRTNPDEEKAIFMVQTTGTENERSYLFIVTPFNSSFPPLETEAWFGFPFESPNPWGKKDFERSWRQSMACRDHCLGQQVRKLFTTAGGIPPNVHTLSLGNTYALEKCFVKILYVQKVIWLHVCFCYLRNLTVTPPHPFFPTEDSIIMQIVIP